MREGVPGDQAAAGQAMHDLMRELFPICRSITGNGVRDTLAILSRDIPLEIREVPTGTAVFDWTVPREWNIRDAYVRDASGRKIIDFAQNNLHVVGYSTPVNATMSLAELKPHLHSLPAYPDAIPYLTSYYNAYWGFCLAHRQLESLADGLYEVVIDASLEAGHLTYGELTLPGASDEEVLVSTYLCHPSMCNDNLSGVVVAAALAQRLAAAARRYTYRFLFIPETIGAITWLSLNRDAVAKIRHGLVLMCIGDPGPMTYKRSRRGTADIDRAVERMFKDAGHPCRVIDFAPTSSDERQYGSPGFNLPVGVLSRTPFMAFPEYHTSADDLTFVQPAALADSLAKCLAVVHILERNRAYESLNPYGEPQLGKRGLYPSLGSAKEKEAIVVAMKWVLNFSDGMHDLLAITDRSGIGFDLIRQAADLLTAKQLLRPL